MNERCDHASTHAHMRTKRCNQLSTHPGRTQTRSRRRTSYIQPSPTTQRRTQMGCDSHWPHARAHHTHTRTHTHSNKQPRAVNSHTKSRAHKQGATMFGDTCALEPPLQHVLTHAMRPWTPCYLTRLRLQLPSICASTQLGST